MTRVLLAAIAVFLGLDPLQITAAPETVAAKPPSHAVQYHAVESIDLASINEGLKRDTPTVDVAIYLGESEGHPHRYKAFPSDLVQSFLNAKQIFAAAGVQLKLRFVRRAVVPAQWLSIQANTITGTPAEPEINAYVGYRQAKWTLTRQAKEVFEGIIEPDDANDRTVYLLYLKQVRMAYFDRTSEGGAEIKSIPTGGLSLPAYLFENRIPRRIRGVITLCRDGGNTGRTIAHELGHKLINVSHEYGKIDPQFEVRGEGGLMLYGRGTEIPSGAPGRWHQERLLLSPFLYRVNQHTMRFPNADYKEHGHYYDPLYGDKVIRFGIMSPNQQR